MWCYILLTVFFLAFTLGILVAGFFGFHIYLLLAQYTTIEYCEKKQDGNTAF